jgi:hypothetical protein
MTILTFWGLKLIQLAIGLAQSLPVPSELPRVHYEICSAMGREYVTMYHTLSHPTTPQNHGAALMALAQANGMQLLFANDLLYACTKAMIAYSKKEPGYLTKAWAHAESQVNRGMQHAIIAILCKGLHMNLQITSLLLLRSVDGQWTFVATLCIATSTLSNIIALVQSFKYLRASHAWFRMLSKEALNDHSLELQPSGSSRNFDSSQHSGEPVGRGCPSSAGTRRSVSAIAMESADELIRQFSWRLGILTMCCGLYTLLLAYAVLKLCGGLLCGGRSMWNITGCTPAYHGRG